MKYIAGAVAAVALIVLMLYLIPVRETVIYDCGMAEWHPDIPADVKEECRKIRRKSSGITV